MEDNEVIVIDVQLNEADIRQRLGEVNTAIRSVEEANRTLKASMKENGDELGINSQLLAQNEALLKSLKAEQSALSGQVRASMQSYQKYGTSIKELTAKMNALKEEYRSLTREQRESAEGEQLVSAIGQLKQEIDEANHALGDFHDNVGNYPGAVEPVTAQIKELTKALIDMKVAGQENTEEYQSTLQRLGELKDAVGDAQQEIKNMASDTSNLDTVLQGAQATAGAFSAALGVMNLLGENDSKTAKELAAAQQKLQAAIAITTGLQAVQNALQKQSALMMGITKLQALAAAKAQDAYTAALGRATIAQRVFNFVAKQNPYVLLAMAIISVVGAIAAFVSGSEEQEKQVRNTNNELNNHLEIIKYLQEQYKSVNTQVEKNIQTKLDYAKATGQSTEAIRAAEDALYEERMKNLKNERKELGYGMVEVTTYQLKYEEAMNNIKVLEENRIKALREHDEESEIYFINEINRIKQIGDYYKTLIDNYNNVNNAISDLANERQAQLTERAKEDADAAKDAAEKARAEAEKRLEIERKRIEELRKFENAYNKLVIDQSKDVVDRYTKEQDEEIAALQHRLDTERTLTVEQRAELNQQIIDLELEKNERIAQMNLDIRTAELQEELRLKQQEIDDMLKQLEKEGVLTAEIRQKYEAQRLQNEQDFNNAVARLVKDHTLQVNQFRRDAERQTLENNEEETISSYERLTKEYELAAQKRLLIANDNEEMIAEAEIQNATEKYNMLVSIDAEAKQLMFASEEEYKVAVLEAETEMNNAIKKRTEMQIESAKKQMQSVGEIFDTLSGVMADYAEESEEAAAYEKILSLAKIAMATGVAIAEGVKVATDSSKTWYEAVIAIATMVATVIANTASAVKMVNSAKFAEGGIVGGNSYSGDKINARLDSGEMVLNREQQANLFRMINQPQLSDNTEQLTAAFAAALSEMPNPVLDYTEFRAFTNDVNEMTNKTIIR